VPAWALIAGAAAAGLYAAFVLVLLVAGRRSEARAVAGFVPDCAVLFRRLLADPGVARWRKLGLVALVAYLAMPIDLVPDFIPVAGQLDDAILVAIALRLLLRADARLLREHWPGPQSSLDLLLRFASPESVDGPPGDARSPRRPSA
jgi:uncharacterized membrane protein YkvA (DUF1232 family)